MKKKSLSLLLAASLPWAFSGCGDKPETASTETSKESAPAELHIESSEPKDSPAHASLVEATAAQAEQVVEEVEQAVEEQAQELTTSLASNLSQPTAQPAAPAAAAPEAPAAPAAVPAAEKEELLSKAETVLKASVDSLKEAASGALMGIASGQSISDSALGQLKALKTDLEEQIPLIRHATPENWATIKSTTETLIAEVETILAELKSE